MSVRIPGPINSAIDAVTRHRFPVIGVTGGAAWTGVALSHSAALGAGAAAFTAGAAVIAVVDLQMRRLRDRAEQAEYNERAALRDVAAARAGDPSAPTVQLRTIGEGGEST